MSSHTIPINSILCQFKYYFCKVFFILVQTGILSTLPRTNSFSDIHNTRRMVTFIAILISHNQLNIIYRTSPFSQLYITRPTLETMN